VNAAVNRLREALGDSAESPRFVETLPRRGYRFVAPVTEVKSPGGGLAAETPKPAADAQLDAPRQNDGGQSKGSWRRTAVASGVSLILVVALVWTWDRWRPASRAPITSLAVLPLENLSGDASREYFADGMTDELITNLASIASLRVISRTSTAHYKGTRKTIPEIARELNVDAVVEGSVGLSASKVRIRAQLVRAVPEEHLWAESYERDLPDVLALQRDVAKAIAGQIKIKLTPDEKAQLESGRQINPAAHDTYLKGRYFWDKRTREGLENARPLFRQAIELEPTYALAYAGLADAYIFCYCDQPRSETLPLARAAALRALEIDPRLAEAHTSLGFIKMTYDWDWAGAEEELRRGIALNPNYAVGHQFYGAYLTQSGHFAEGIQEARKALELDPLSLALNWSLGMTLYHSREYDQAEERLRKTVEMDPGYPLAHTTLGHVYLVKKMYSQAVSEYKQAIALRNNTPESKNNQAMLAVAYAQSGDTMQAKRVIENLTGKSVSGAELMTSIAAAYAALDERDHAISALEQAYNAREFTLFFLKVDPRFDSLRSDIRFQDLLRRIGFPP